MPAPLTRDYAAFASGVASAQAIPGEAFAVARLGFTDCAGVMLAGLNEDVVRRLDTFAAGQGGRPVSRLLLGERRASPMQAGMINATAAHAHDFDDFAFSNHPSAVLVPTILAAADAATRPASGALMATAYVVGYEIWADLMKREPDHLHSKGWHPTAVFGPVAAAAAACTVLGYDEKLTSHAIALACSLAGGVFENFGTMAKPMHGGRAAEAGLTAAMLAGAGIEASPTAVEGQRGLLRALSPAGRVDVERPVQLGRTWHILKERLNIKKHPTVGASQRSIDAVLGLLATRAIDPGKVRRIVPRVSVKHLAVMTFSRPQTALEAKFSLEFAVSCALIHGAVGLAQISDAVVEAPAMQAMMAKVEVETTTESLPDWPAAAPFDVVKVHLDDGSVIVSPEVRRATGHGDTPLSVAELRAKFDSCAAYAGVASAPSAALFAAMQRIDTLAGIVEVPVLPS